MRRIVPGSAPDPCARVAAWSQLVAEGLSPYEIRTHLRAGRWVRAHHGVIILTGSAQLTAELRAQAAVLSLGPSAVVSHLSAARIHGLAGADGLPGFWMPRNDSIHVTVPRASSLQRDGGIQLHRHDLDSSEVTDISGLAVTTVLRTLADLLLKTPRDVAAVAIEAALQRGLISRDDLTSLALQVRGRHGVRKAQSTLAQIRPGAESPLETLSRLKFADLGLVASVIQPTIVDAAGRFLGRADLGFGGNPPKILGEADGRESHEGNEMWAKDARREEGLRLAGCEVVRWTWLDLVHDCAAIVARIQAFAHKLGVIL